MAKQGYISYKIDNYHTLGVTWIEQSFSKGTDGNYYSYIRFIPELKVEYGTPFTNGITKFSLTVTAYAADGETVRFTAKNPQTTNWSKYTFTLTPGQTKTISNSMDAAEINLNRGNGSTDHIIPVTFTFDITSTTDAIYDIHSGESIELSRALTREEQPYIHSRSNGWTQVQSPSVGYVVPLPDRVESLKLLVGFSTDQIIATRDIPIKSSNVYNIEFTDAEQKALIGGIPTSTSGTVYFFLKAVSDGLTYDSIGVASTFRIYGGYPTWYADSDVSDINAKTLAITGNNKIFVRYESDAQFFLFASAANGAWITNYTVSSNLQSASANVYQTNQNGVNLTIKAIDSWPCAVTTTDSRGLTKGYSEFKSDYLFIEYIKPTCTLDTSVSAQGEITATISGAVFTGYFDALPGYDGNNPNTVTVEYRYKLKSQHDTYFSAWTVANFSEVNDDYIFDNAYRVKVQIPGLNYKEAYVFEARITDRLHTVESGQKQALAMTVFDWSKNDFNFNVPVNINGDIYQYNNLIALPSFGTWVPQCNACTNPTTSYGNYILIGDMCFVNFYFEGKINVEPSLTNWKLYLYGLPYTPHTGYRWQAGGGNCQGYALPAKGSTTSTYPATPPSGSKDGHRFTGWSIEGGVIYGRTQQSYDLGAESSQRATTEAVTGQASNYQYSYNYQKPTGSFYITALPNQTFYASGTILYKIDPDQGGVVG